MTKHVFPGTCRGVGAKRLRIVYGASQKPRYYAFTLIELVLVVGIIIVLAGLVLSTVGYARKKGARARAETEIAAMSAACENYKADNAVYPRDNPTPGYTDALDARQQGDPSVYQNASLYLFTKLSGLNQDQTPITGARSYFSFKPQMLSINSGNVTAIKDPFGYSYGYSTANQADPVTPKGYNPTFDLWSTAGLTANPGSPDPNNPDPITPQWIKNW
jgi:type II secretory pathway pseudopilin PulG